MTHSTPTHGTLFSACQTAPQARRVKSRGLISDLGRFCGQRYRKVCDAACYSCRVKDHVATVMAATAKRMRTPRSIMGEKVHMPMSKPRSRSTE